jgi:excisionase family DNA binding protein
MSEEVYTVEQFAERLKLHPKTVLRFIREGRVRAVKVGKSYRILRSEMEAMTGAVRGASPSAVRVTSVVDVADVEPEAAQRLARLLPAARMAQEAHPDPMKIDVVYDPDRRQLKVLIVGSPGDTAAMLKMVEALSDS